MRIDWQPDPDNIYLTSGHDNLALHRAPADFNPEKHQRLDHIGFFIAKREDVDTWFTWLSASGADIRATPRDHRDGRAAFIAQIQWQHRATHSCAFTINKKNPKNRPNLDQLFILWSFCAPSLPANRRIIIL